MIRTELVEKKPPSDAITSILEEHFSSHSDLRVLEAGCGSASHVVLPKKNISLAGIDISKEQLEKNKSIEEKILGDLQTHQLPTNAYDIIICWDVLEHLSDPLSALANLFDASKIGGVLVLAFPNVMSVKGLITKFSPFAVHKYYYRIMNFKSYPFETFLRFSMSPSNIIKVANARGLVVHSCALYDGTPARLKDRRLIYSLLRTMTVLLNAVTLFKHDFGRSDCVMILKK